MQSMQRIWKRIEACFETLHASALLSHFQPGATDEDIQAVEAALGIAFPEDVKASYHMHNGSNRQALIGDPDQNLRELCSLEEVVSNWNMMEKYAKGWKVAVADDWLNWDGQPIKVRVECWNVKWIPLLNSNGNMICLDLAPTPHGQIGQIIENDPETGTKLVAPSWQAFLSAFANDLESGEYSYEEGAFTWS